MKKRRITAFAAAVLLLASLLCACKKNGGKKPTGTGGGTESSGESRYTPDVPDGITFNDETFSVLGIDPALCLSTIVDFDYESPPEDVVQEAIYNRNRRIEDTYRIDFEHEYVPISMTLTALQTQFRAQEDDYQLIMLISREAFPAAIEGTALTPDSIPHVNIKQPWYLQKVNNALTISGTQLLAYTDESMNTYMQSVCVFFNTEIVKNNSLLTSPYEMVKNGTWTLDNFYKTALDAKSDANGDGVYSPLDGDVYGVISEADMFWPAMWVGADSKTVTVDKTGTPEFTAPKDQKLLGILSGLNDALKNEGLFLNTEKFFGSLENDVCRDAGTQYFSHGGGLYRVGTVGNIQLLRSMEADFGVVPLPKYDENQADHLSRTIDGWLHVAPSTVQKTERLGVILEALGAESKNYVIPAFFDRALDYKYIRDEDKETTREMLDMIFDNTTMDLGDTVWMANIRGPLCQVIESGKGNFSSRLASLEMLVKKNCIQTVLDYIEKRG